VEGQIAKARSQRTIEEAPKLHEQIIANLARIPDVVADATKRRLPWLLVIASLVLAALLGYTLFVGYVPAKQRIVGLERELKDVYAREADVDTRQAQRDRQLQELMAERDRLAQRVVELERDLAAARARRPTP
jgi:Tfp pilus assembly protein PilN